MHLGSLPVSSMKHFYRDIYRKVRIATMDVLFLDHPKCPDLIFICLTGLMISTRIAQLITGDRRL
jgi:hypothetical protein